MPTRTTNQNFNIDDSGKPGFVPGFFTYPMDIQDGAPFIYLGAYPYQSLVDARDYKETIIKGVDQREYVAEFAFYVPKSLKFSYNPQIEQVAARIDPKLVKGLQGSGIRDVMKGSAATAGNYFAATSKLDSALAVGLEAFKQWRMVTRGQIFDPKQLNMFKDAPYMTYTLTYRFEPESFTEASHIDLMIKILRMLSTAKMSSTETLGQIIKLSKDIDKEASKVENLEDADSKIQKLNEIIKETKRSPDYKKDANGKFIYQSKGDELLKKQAKIYNDIVNGIKDSETKEKLKDSFVNELNSPSGMLGDTNIEAKEPPKLTPTQERLQQAKEGWEALKLTVEEAVNAFKEVKMDVWIHPHLFDLYLVIPPTDSNQKNQLGIGADDSFKTINSKSEIDMYKDAKGLILSGLDISFIESPNRDDVPFYSDRLPAGWEVNMTFTSVSKTTRS